ncbi:carboxylesterase/lipase family protein [Tessaracoccus caeni]|uniref:carboxylesterase/lipase family protein n=1 Tax=Tessaracoccus caeni TaxID=3031239 RepID=UPI0023DC492D|nr:carboxylesterase family protein [Tessaracoccus caeni]MDF1488625.1 carboxylesterase family protein [Tessaracoccus caeni]
MEERTEEFVEVDTTAGRVRGRWRPTTGGRGEPRSAAFLGIPFAEAPVGELRFAAPAPKAPWEGILDALDFGATAQRGDPGITLIPEPSIEGESTLNVNVFTPRPEPAASGEGLPVMVWIHGGGYVAGSPASPWYDGRNFNRDGVVTVTVSYRLGFDGFGWIDGVPQNRGVRDWLLALEWVQRNIAAFGGDPGRVTIAGQSAGGGAVLTLLGMEKAQHLFHGVYAISGAVADLTETRARAFSQKLAEAAGIAPTREGFASVPEERLLELQRKAADLGEEAIAATVDEGLPLGPVIDGDLIPRPTSESLRMGVGADTPLVIGATGDEFTMAFTGAAERLRDVPQEALLDGLGLRGSARERYLSDNADIAALGPLRLAGRLLTDRMFRVPLRAVVADRGRAPTWVYRFSWPSATFGFAEHCVDVPFFFDCLDGPAIEPLAGPNPPQELADQVHAGAVSFVVAGDPGWTRHDEATRISRVYDLPTRDEADAYASVDALI